MKSYQTAVILAFLTIPRINQTNSEGFKVYSTDITLSRKGTIPPNQKFHHVYPTVKQLGLANNKTICKHSKRKNRSGQTKIQTVFQTAMDLTPLLEQ